MICKSRGPLWDKDFNNFWGKFFTRIVDLFGLVSWTPNIGQDPDVRKDWRQEEKGAAVHEMIR